MFDFLKLWRSQCRLPKLNGRRPSSRLRFDALEDRLVPAFVITPTFDSTITSDPNASTIIASINQVLAAYQNTFTNNVTVHITFQETTSGLGSSSTFYVVKTYTSYHNAIIANKSGADDTAALATLPSGASQPISGTADNTHLRIPTALTRALGLSGGTITTDSTISLNTSLMNLSRTGTQSGSKYDLLSVVAHELDEALSLGSGLDNANNGDPISTMTIKPADLFRYSAAGVRSFNTTASSLAYFSIDNGTTNLARFNQTAGGDFGDWYSPGGQTPQVQDAFGTAGATPNLNVELRRLDVVGYTRVAPVALNVTSPGEQIGLKGVATAFNLGSVTNGNGPFQVTVNWNDGSANTTFFVDSTGSLGTKTHTYSTAGISNPTVTVTDFTSQTGSTSFTVKGDNTNPVVSGVPNDGAAADVDVQTSATTLKANWSGVFADAESGIAKYEWKVGTTAGGSQLFDFTSAGITGTSASLANLPLVQGQTYFVTVRATNGVGLQSIATSDGVTIDAISPTVVSINRSNPAGSSVSGGSVTFAVTFSESVTGVVAGEFQPVTTGGAAGSITQVTGSGSAYAVTVSGITGSGTLGLNLVDHGVIHDQAGNPLASTGSSVAFQTQQILNPGASSNPNAVVVADVDGDGFVDVVSANYGTHSVSVMRGNGDGAFKAAQSSDVGNLPYSHAIGDVNGDGKQDLVVANYHDDTVSVLLGNGNGTFQARQIFSTGSGSHPHAVALVDADGDGKLDVVVANRQTNTVGVLLGNGNGTLKSQTTYAAGNNPVALAVGDLNGDGKQDVVVANGVDNSVVALLSNGNGTFQVTQPTPTGQTPSSVAIGDLNGDGKLDLAVANANANTASVLLGNGNGTFQAKQDFAAASTPASVAIGDVNGDGKPDLAVANANNASVSVLLGLGGGNFAAQQAVAVGSHPMSVAGADFNRDGRLDLVVANSLDNAIGTRLNSLNGNFTGQTYSVDPAPTIVSNGGGATASINVAENVAAVTTVLATDPDVTKTLTYSIVGGADAGAFAIDGSSGALRFASPPEFENPTDSGTDNVYDVIVQASDGALTDSQAIAVTVTDVGSAAALVYVDASWNALTTGTAIADADPTLSGNQPATMGVTAFALLQGGTEAVAAGGTVTLLAGSYSQGATFAQPFHLNVPAGTAAVTGTLTGSPQLDKTGSGVLSLAGTNIYNGGTTVGAGTLLVNGDAALGASAVAVAAPGVLEFAGSTSTARTFNLGSGALKVDLGATLTLNAAAINGGVLQGTIATTAGQSAVFAGSTISSSATIVANGSDTFTGVSNAGALTIAVDHSASLGAFVNQASGVLTVAGTANVNGFSSAGQVAVSGTGALANTGASALTFGSGSVTTIAAGGSIDVGNVDATVTGLVKNSGSFGSSTNAVVVDLGGRVQGPGTYHAVVTQNGGAYSPGNGPGAASLASFPINGGGTFDFEIANAIGAAANVSGWDMATIAPNAFSPASASLDFTATAANPYVITLTTRADDGLGTTAGLASHFDPSQSYAWKFVDASDSNTSITGAFAANAFDVVATGFQNAFTGTFSVELRDGGKGLYVVYTPPAPAVTSVTAFVGPISGGNVVVIAGANFTGATAVTFGGVSALDFTVNSASQITATVPAGSSTVDVVVTTAGGASDTAAIGDDYTYVVPAVTSVVVNGGDVVARNKSNVAPTIAGQSSVVEQVLVTFNQKVKLDADAFTVTPVALASTIGTIPSPATVAVIATGVDLTGDPATGFVQYVLTFAPGAGVNSIANGSPAFGNTFTTLNDGFYQLNTIGAKVHAGVSDAAADRTDKFWSLFGAVNPGDVKTTGALGDGNDTLLVDGLALNDVYTAFGSNFIVNTPPYNPAFDWNLDGNVDGVDLSHLYANFGTIWQF